MTHPDPVPVSVRGGTHGIDAHADDLLEVARLFGQAATDAGTASCALHGYLLDPGIFTSAVLDPVGASSFEADLIRALDGTHGLTWLALECAALSLRLRATAAAYRLADQLGSTANVALEGIAGLPHALLSAETAAITTGSPQRVLNTLLTDDPALFDELAMLSAPVLDRLGAGDGHPVVREVGVDSTAAGRQPPRSLADLLRGLTARDHGRPGEVDVRMLIRADGSRAVIVDIPGTKSWNPLPNGDVTNPTTDIRAMTGRSTSYERGVLDAMRRAGVRASDNVMFVGHSEGGLVAIQAAITAHHSGEFNVTHVVTAGSPIGRTVGHVPVSVQVLALENTHDVVPHLDGAINPPRPNVTTVSVDHDTASILANHDVGVTYVRAAGDVDASHDGSIRDFLAGAHPFLDATAATTHRYVITRGY